MQPDEDKTHPEASVDIIVRSNGTVTIDPPTVTDKQLESLQWALDFMKKYERKHGKLVR